MNHFLELYEAKPFDYSTEHQKGKLRWAFSNQTQTFVLSANTFRNGKVLNYRRKGGAGATLFVLSSVVGNKTTRNFKTIQKPLNVIATVAELVSSELTESRVVAAVMVRLPNKVNMSAAVRIAGRYVKLKAPQYEVLGYIDDGAKYSYILIAKRGQDIDIKSIFGDTGVSIKTVQTLRDLIGAADDEVKHAVAETATKEIERKFKVSEISGGDEVPYEVEDFLSKNPPPIFGAEINARNAIDVNNKLIAGTSLSLLSQMYGAPSEDSVSDALGEVMTYANVTDPEWFVEVVDYIVKTGVSLSDFIGVTDKFKTLDKMMMSKFGGKYNYGPLYDRLFLEPYKNKIMLEYGRYKPTWTHSANLKYVESYTSMGYDKAAKFLLSGEYETEGSDIVLGMDDVFKDDGIILPPNTNLFRSMKFNEIVIEEILTNKMFHFRTFVSTSLSASIGLTFNAIGLGVFTAFEPFNLDEDWLVGDMNVGMLIRDAHNVPVIIPGRDSTVVSECEVILPRGVTIKINDFLVRRSGTTTGDGFLDCSVVPLNQITNESVVYDGDAFVETGKLVRFNMFEQYGSFGTQKPKQLDKKCDDAANLALSVLKYGSPANTPTKTRDKFINHIG